MTKAQIKSTDFNDGQSDQQSVGQVNRPSAGPDREVRMPLGQVVSVAGAQVLIMLDLRRDSEQNYMPRVGRMICIETGASDIVASVSGLSSPTPGIDSEEGEVLLAELELIGEFQSADAGTRQFSRGISTFPALGDIAASMTRNDLSLIYGVHEASRLRVGYVSDEDGIPASLNPDKLLEGNFALLGAVGAGKSSAAAVLVRALVRSRHPCRIVLLDPYNEYTRSFGRAATIMPITSGLIAHWMLSFRELVYLLEIIGGPLSKQEIDLLAQAVGAAKKRFGQANPTASSMRAADGGVKISVDTPIPYRLTDITAYLERLSQTEGDVSTELYRQLRARIEVAAKDQQYRAIFGSVAARDSLAAFLGDLFRIPTDGKPITILQFGELEPQLCEVIVSLVARYAQMIADSQKGRMPLLLMIEDAHRYLPENQNVAPLSSRTLNSIMEKNNKISVSLGLISSRVRSLSTAALEHCNTMLTLRLPSRTDQEYLLRMTPETASGLLANVGVIDTAECVAIGAGVTIPMRLGFDKLPIDAVPTEKVRPSGQGVDLPPTVAELGQPFIERLVDEWRYNQD